jgi:uncharacterized protein (DUF924 family)
VNAVSGPGPNDVLTFWFADEARDLWFEKNATFDATCRQQLGALADDAAAGRLNVWASTPRGALALVILLDQVPRNLHRGTPAAFAQDAKAREVARRALSAGLDADLAPAERLFLYLPFEHSEDAADQALAVELIERLGHPDWTDATRRHRDIILRFGRFPHRNAALGRPSTPEELAFLAEPGSSF